MGKNNIRYTFEQVKEIIEGKGYELLSDEYKGNKVNLKIRDTDGYLGFAPFASIQNNTTFRKFYTLNPFTLDNIKNWLIVEKKPFELLDNEYIDKSHKMKWKCNICNKEFKRDWNSVINGRGCLHCKFDNNDSEDFVKEKWVDDLITSKGYEWIAGEYKTQSTKLTIKDKIGYKYKVSIVNFKNGVRLHKFNSLNVFCKENVNLWFSLNMPDYKLLTEGKITNRVNVDLVDQYGYYYNCKFRHLIEGSKPVRFDVENIHSIKNIQHYLDEHLPDYKVLDNKFNGINNKTTLIDDYGYYYEVLWGNIMLGHMPVRFHKFNNYTIHNIRNWIKLNNKDYMLLSDNYVSSSDTLSFKCTNNNCGGIFSISYSGLMALKNGCPICSVSRGEYEIRLFLNRNDIDYIPQMKFDNLLGVGGGKLSYDFYLPEHNLLCEYQGEFHDREVFKGHDLEKQKEHDRRKREYAKNNNIKLLEIWYWEFDNIEEILIKELGLDLNLVNT